MLLGSASVTDDLVRMAGAAAENLVYPQPNFDLESDRAGGARRSSRPTARKYGEDPDIYAAHGYDALKLLAQAIENGGGTHPDDVRIGFASIKAYEGAAGRTAFDENGDVVRYPRMFIIREGQADALRGVRRSRAVPFARELKPAVPADAQRPAVSVRRHPRLQRRGPPGRRPRARSSPTWTRQASPRRDPRRR